MIEFPIITRKFGKWLAYSTQWNTNSYNCRKGWTWKRWNDSVGKGNWLNVVYAMRNCTKTKTIKGTRDNIYYVKWKGFTFSTKSPKAIQRFYFSLYRVHFNSSPFLVSLLSVYRYIYFIMQWKPISTPKTSTILPK